MIISSSNYKFVCGVKGVEYSMSKSKLKFVIEIDDLQIVTSDKISQQDLLMITFSSKFSGERRFKVKNTPMITDDSDTIGFMKYFMHNIVKKNLIRDFKYEEILPIDQLMSEFQNYEPLKGRTVC